MDTGRTFAVVFAVAGLVIGAIQAAKPDVLGITPAVSAWLGVAGAVVAGVQAMLPRVQAPKN